jgi:predicted MFS family arabinose efflux permease
VRALAPAVGVPFVTTAAGRSSIRTWLLGSSGVTVVGTAALAAVVSGDGPVVVIYAATAINAVAVCCVRPLVTALMPTLITRPAELVATNAAAAMVDGISSVAGPVVAGVALATLGSAPALWIAALLAVAAAAVVTVFQTEDDGGHHARPSSAFAGFREMASSESVPLVVVLSVAQTFVRGALNVLVVVYAVESLDLRSGGVGLLLGAIGVGGLIGFPVAVRVVGAGALGRSLAVALVLWGAPIAISAAVDHGFVAVLLFAVIGLGNSMVDISSDTLLQRLVPRGSLASVAGTFDSALYAGMGLGAIVAERLLNAFGIATALTATGLLLPALALLTWRRLRNTDHVLRGRNADIALLQIHGIFSPVVMSTVDHLARAMAREAYGAGDVIMRKGDAGDRFLVIETGEVEIRDDHGVVAVLGPGDGFGELSLLRDIPRTATAIAASDVVARSLRRDDFLTGVSSHRSAEEAAAALADERLRELEERQSGQA